jgi:hypothetical protein
VREILDVHRAGGLPEALDRVVGEECLDRVAIASVFERPGNRAGRVAVSSSLMLPTSAPSVCC